MFYLTASFSSRMENVVQMLVVLMVFIIVIALTWLTTKWVGGFQKSQFSNKNMKPIESMSVGNNKYIQLVQVGEVYLILGVGKDEVHTIAKLTKEELPELLEHESMDSAAISGSFQSILSKLSNKDSYDSNEEE